MEKVLSKKEKMKEQNSRKQEFEKRDIENFLRILENDRFDLGAFLFLLRSLF